MTGLTAEMIDALPKLELCAIIGVGLETTNLPRARERGIVVTTTPVLYDDVADLAVILGMCASRRIAAADRFVRSGQWLQGPDRAGAEVQRQARRHPGTRPDRHGAGAAAAGVRHDDRLLRSAAQVGRPLPGVSEPARARAERRHPVPRGRRRPGRQAHRQPARSWKRSGPRASSSTSRAAGWSTRRRWSRRSPRASSARPASTCSRRSPRCRTS